MSWIYLIIAILAEVSGTTMMKFSQGFSKLLPSLMIFVFYGLSLSFLTISLKNIDLSVAYAIWSGLGTAIIAVMGILFLKESVSILKIISVLLIIAGVVGLNLAGGTQEVEKTSTEAHLQEPTE